MSNLRSNAVLVLSRMLKEVEQCDEDDLECWASEVDTMLDEMRFQDFFGTEGQTDPRGDYRNGEWSIYNPEGKV